MQFFGSLQLLMALLGSSWSVLGGFGSRMGSPKVFQNVIKSFSKNDQKRDQFWVPKWVPKKLKTEIAGLRHFLPGVLFCLLFIFSFSLGFGALWVPLGSLLGPLEALLGGLWTQKPQKNLRFFKVFEKAVF